MPSQIFFFSFFNTLIRKKSYDFLKIKAQTKSFQQHNAWLKTAILWAYMFNKGFIRSPYFEAVSPRDCRVHVFLLSPEAHDIDDTAWHTRILSLSFMARHCSKARFGTGPSKNYGTLRNCYLSLSIPSKTRQFCWTIYFLSGPSPPKLKKERFIMC